jgi:hypothetical protein
MPTLSVGQLVSVPWGLDELEGTVLRIYSTGIGERVVVAVHVPGASEDETTLTLPIESVEPIGNVPHRLPPGAWVAARAYERAVANALLRVASEIAENVEVSEPETDQGIDLVLHSGQSTVLAQAKYASSRSRLSAKEVDRALTVASRATAPFILVTNVDLAQSARNRFHESETPRRFGLVKWRGPEDDADLKSELQLLLA